MLQFVAPLVTPCDVSFRRKVGGDCHPQHIVHTPVFVAKKKRNVNPLAMCSTPSNQPKRAPRSIREARVVVVGGGPVGTVAACMLWFRDVKKVTLIEKVADFQSLNPFRSYALGLYPRGLKALETVPGLSETISAAGNPLRKIIKLDTKGKPKAVNLPASFNSVLYFLRDNLLGRLKSFILNNTSVATKYGTKVIDIRYETTGIELDIETDGAMETLFCDLLIAADGRNSIVVTSLKEAAPSIVQSKRGFDSDERMSAAVGLNVKSIVLDPSEIKKTGITDEDIGSSLLSLESAVSSQPVKERVKLGMFPTSKDQISFLGGVLGVMVNPEHSLLWSIKTVDEFYNLLQRNFPSLDVRKLARRDRVETFLQTKPGSFPPITRVDSLTATVGSNFGVIVLGDAAHSFPPDTGLGVNSGFEDVAHLAEALDGVLEDSSIHDVLTEYERLNNEETSALVYIARVASPYQYGNAPLRQKLQRINSVIRILLSKLFPFLFAPPLNTQVLTLRPFSEMVQGDRRSIRIIVSTGLAKIAIIGAIAGHAFVHSMM